ncbi:hypothetical protein BJ508DRAFT_315986 [Ascobolus immersus RN42]|uniref:Uncharacterized protein n=1 Tax=Ascobolus immersus RN42 TaxID=1160509 RepID=A0A3N4HF18_ASCIM|nr:hypothetical protein BJ508DRAFT_315986 [Ascobolus immersus RN42]
MASSSSDNQFLEPVQDGFLYRRSSEFAQNLATLNNWLTENVADILVAIDKKAKDGVTPDGLLKNTSGDQVESDKLIDESELEDSSSGKSDTTEMAEPTIPNLATGYQWPSQLDLFRELRKLCKYDRNGKPVRDFYELRRKLNRDLLIHQHTRGYLHDLGDEVKKAIFEENYTEYWCNVVRFMGVPANRSGGLDKKARLVMTRLIYRAAKELKKNPDPPVAESATK